MWHSRPPKVALLSDWFKQVVDLLKVVHTLTAMIHQVYSNHASPQSKQPQPCITWRNRLLKARHRHYRQAHNVDIWIRLTAVRMHRAHKFTCCLETQLARPSNVAE